MATLESKDLPVLREHWGDAYVIDWDFRSRTYRAIRRDTRAALNAENPEDLWKLIRADYIRNPVPREGKAL